jgi:hypothetical protein
MRRDRCGRSGVFAAKGLVSLSLIAALLLLPLLPLPAQEENGESDGDGTKNFEYEPYTQEEFPQWAHDLRRFETILIGSIPITFFFANIGFDTAAYVANDYDQNYLPLFFGSSPEKDELRYDTRMDRLAVSLSLSAAIAFLDYFLGRVGEE